MSEIYEERGTVTLVDGVGMFRYKIRKPTPSVSRKIGCAVTDPVNKSINMFVNPGDVAPPVTPETFKVSTKMEGEYIVYDVVSNLLYSDTSAPFNVKETSVDVKPIETFTISSVKSGNNVVFTIKSSDLVSKTVVNVTMTEYRPGTPITVIKTNVANVTLNNGVGTVTHAINQTQPPVDQKVEGKLTNTPTVRTEVTVPKYVAPAPVTPRGWHRTEILNTPSRNAGTHVVNVKVTWGDLPTVSHIAVNVSIRSYVPGRGDVLYTADWNSGQRVSGSHGSITLPVTLVTTKTFTDEDKPNVYASAQVSHSDVLGTHYTDTKKY